MLREWRRWRETTNLSNGTFFKFYMWDRILIRPRRKARRWKLKGDKINE
jgi:hypothetical protein